MPYFLRELSRVDLARLTKWRNERDLVNQLNTAFRYVGQETDLDWFNEYVANRFNNIRLAICETESEKFIGVVYLLEIDWINRNAEHAIWIGDKSFQGRGAGEFATRSVLHHAFTDLNLHRIHLTVLATNERALKLYRKVGFVEEGRLRQAVYKEGHYVDLIRMGMLEEEYVRPALKTGDIVYRGPVPPEQPKPKARRFMSSSARTV
ncbi:GNAT family N-acetyltransferase [Noviherbaspirillum sp.]|uniref:GNAT family N-acetyltransferase n=1 Tax=Noviherbaspirillum sp. TaxID=1926288 RepID=UPI002FE0A869